MVSMSVTSVTLDTTVLPVGEQFDAWARHSDNTALTPVRAGPFVAKGTVWDLGGASLATCWLDPFVSDRTAAHVSAGSAEFIQLVALREGSVTLATPEGAWQCEAPDLFVRDYRQPSCATSSTIEAIVLYLPSAFLEQAAGVTEHQGPLPTCPETTLLGGMLAMVVQELSGTLPANAGLFARALRDLFAAALIRVRQDTAYRQAGGPGGRDRLAAQRAYAKHYIATEQPGRLSLERMIHELGISRSVLFSLFKVHGGVLAYDRQLRLRALYRALRDSSEGRSIAELGEAHGFFDRSALAHSFRRMFGRTQSEVRQAGLPVSIGGTPAERIRTVINQLQ